jgi:hypothetical protein
MPLFSILSGDLIDMSNLLDTLKDRQYDFIYLSIGGKMNEPCVTFQKPKKYVLSSNSQYQLIPEFLKERHDDLKALILVIDNFNNDESYETNKRYLSIYENFDCIMVNKFFDLPYIKEFIRILLQFDSHINIDSTNFMITNYIRYMNNPNEAEAKLEFGIPDTIQECLNTFVDIRYRKCLFQWFGYNIFLYNMICNYSFYYLAANQAQQIYNSDSSTGNRPFRLWNHTELVQKTKNLLLWKYSYDITDSYIINDTKIVSSIYDNYLHAYSGDSDSIDNNCCC